MFALATQDIVLASGNAGKIKELQALLAGSRIIAQADLGVEECEETGTTFIENAILKARSAARQCRLPAIADDSGLVVDALGGAPGVLSARYAGIGANSEANITKLLHALLDVPHVQRSARFICVLVFMAYADDPCPVIAQGSWEGRILDQPAGRNGFGYDPVFWVASENCSAAELTPERKNALSHRGQALRQLTAALQAMAA